VPGDREIVGLSTHIGMYLSELRWYFSLMLVNPRGVEMELEPLGSLFHGSKGVRPSE